MIDTDQRTPLTRAELEGYREQGGGQHATRYYCPIHGGDNRKSLQLDPETGRFKCHNCDAWGYLEEDLERWKASQPGRNQPTTGRRSKSRSNERSPLSKKVRPYKSDRTAGHRPRARFSESDLRLYQQALEGARGYLDRRGIPFEIAKGCGLGFASAPPATGRASAPEWIGPETWDGKTKTVWPNGRLVIPHTVPATEDVETVNLYGRAIETDSDAGNQKHRHLSGGKGVFNAAAITGESGPLFVSEGALDTLALIAAGYPRSVAIFGKSAPRGFWEWIANVETLVLAFDTDESGLTARSTIGTQALLCGKTVCYVGEIEYGAQKDANAAWCAAELAVNMQE